MPAPGHRNPEVWSEDGSVRRCSRCRQWKPATTDYFEGHSTRGGIGSRCRACLREYDAGRKDRQRRNHLRRTYTMTPLEYEDMLRAQGGVCELCKGGAGERLHVDHDHETGLVRALLCSRCNRGLGFAQDDPVLLRRWADYVERFRAKAALRQAA